MYPYGTYGYIFERYDHIFNMAYTAYTGGNRSYNAVYLKSHEMYALGEPCLQSCVLEEPRDGGTTATDIYTRGMSYTRQPHARISDTRAASTTRNTGACNICVDTYMYASHQ